MYNKRIQDKIFDILSESTLIVITDTPSFEQFNMMINSVIAHVSLINVTVATTLQRTFNDIFNWYEIEFDRRVPAREQGDQPFEREREQISVIYQLQLKYKERIIEKFTRIIAKTGVL